MKGLVHCIVVLGLAGLTGCVTSRAGPPEPDRAQNEPLETDLRDAGGQRRATAIVSQIGDSLRVRVEAEGLAPGAYGAHLHAVGRCDPPGFESAGPHWNPTGQQHGKDNPQGMHKGDLPNLLVGTDGRGSFEFTVLDAWLLGGGRTLLDADGAALVIHSRAYDYRTDPSGNSGPRIACGLLR